MIDLEEAMKIALQDKEVLQSGTGNSYIEEKISEMKNLPLDLNVNKRKSC